MDRSPLSVVRARLRAIVSGVRFGKFASVGVVGYAVDNLVLAGLIELVAVPVAFAKLASAESAIVVMFAVNENWTFSRWGGEGWRPLAGRFLKSNLVRWGGAGVAVGVLLVLHHAYGIHYFVANTVGIGVGFVVNFVLESFYTWRVHASR